MTKNEFKMYTGLEVTLEEYYKIHEQYIAKATTEGIDKQTFCLQYLQSIEASKKEQKETMKYLKDLVKWNKKHYAEYVNGEYEYDELEEDNFSILLEDGTLITMYSGMDIDELKNIKFTKIIYIAQQGNDNMDTLTGSLSNLYNNDVYNVWEEYNNNIALIGDHIENNIERLQRAM